MFNKMGSYGEFIVAFVILLFVVALAYKATKMESSDSHPSSILNISNQSIALDAATVASHSKEADCWTIIDGNVYDITDYIGIHPGGKQTILKACGIDSTTIFNNKGGQNPNGHSSGAKTILNGYLIGKFGTSVVSAIDSSGNKLYFPKELQDKLESYNGSTLRSYMIVINYKNKLYTLKWANGKVSVIDGDVSTVVPTTGASCIDKDTLKTHNKQGDCWLDINGNVYAVTDYIGIHPGGTSIIVSNCGTDATVAFETKGGGDTTHSSDARNTLKSYKIGSYCAGGTDVPTDTTTTSETQITISISSPSNNQVLAVGTTSVDFNVSTNVGGTCKWDLSNVAYGSMTNTFNSLSATTFTATIVGLSNGASTTAYVKCQNSSTNEASAQVLFSVANPEALSATITSPTASQAFPSGTTSVSLSANTTAAATCKWSLSDGDYSAMSNIFSTTGGIVHTATISGLSNGITRTAYVRCSDIYGNNMTSSSSVTFNVVNPTDVQPVVNISAIITSPTASQAFAVGTTSANLNVSTNVGGTCKWGTSNVAYLSLPNTMSAFTSTNHRATITSLTNGLSQTVYVKCQNSSTNEVSAQVSFSVQSPVQITASVTYPTSNQVLAYGTTSANLNVSTNVGGTCKWGTSNVAYLSLPNTMSAFTSTNHRATITSLTNGLSQTVYVKCQNSSTNEASTSVAFSVSSTNQITLDATEVAKHSTTSNCWIRINNRVNNVYQGEKVYDFSNWANLHPGNPVSITNQCGKNATSTFNGQTKHNNLQTNFGNRNGHSVIGDLCIGALNSPLTTPPTGC